jgi:hypothetical protein
LQVVEEGDDLVARAIMTVKSGAGRKTSKYALAMDEDVGLGGMATSTAIAREPSAGAKPRASVVTPAPSAAEEAKGPAKGETKVRF